MKWKIIVLVVVALACSSYAFASEEHDHGEQKGSMTEHHEAEEKSDAVNVGNKICPISGEDVEAMEEAYTVEYNGKIYNVCCKMCAKDFKKNPEKYSKIAEESIEGEHEGSHHDH